MSISEQDIGGFLDLAYGASAEPDLWPRVLERFADLVGGVGGALVWQNQASRKGEGLGVRIDPAVLKVYFGAFASRHPSQRWMNSPRDRMRHFIPHIVTDDEAMPKAELMRTEFYNEFMRPFDLHSIVRLGLAAQSQDAAFLAVSRPKTRDRFADDDMALAGRLHPHLIRAFSLGQKIGAAQSRLSGGEEILARSAHAMFVLDADGAVRHLNAAGEAMIAGHLGLTVTGGRLVAAGADQAARLGALIAQAASPQASERRGGSMALVSSERSLPLSVTVAPVRADAPIVFRQRPSVLVCVTDLEAGANVSEQRLRLVLGLTPAEARVAVALFEGQTPKETAQSLGVSFHTVRAQLMRIFEKTGTSRQAELVRLIGRTTDWAD